MAGRHAKVGPLRALWRRFWQRREAVYEGRRDTVYEERWRVLYGRLLKWPDVHKVVHLFTLEAAEAGRRVPGQGGFIALCGADVTLGAMSEPGRRNCPECLSRVIPIQRRNPPG